MKTIYKYPLEINDAIAVHLPEGAEVLTVQAQNDVPCMWVREDPDAPIEARFFCWHGTDHDTAGCGRYVGTIQLRQGRLVFHLFEALPDGQDVGKVRATNNTGDGQ